MAVSGEMSTPSVNEIESFDRRTQRVATACRIAMVILMAFGLFGIVAPFAVGEPEAAIAGFTLFVLGAGILFLAVGRPEVASSPTYFAVAQGLAWWNGLKIVVHLCAFGCAWIAAGAFITPSWAQISPSARTPIVGVVSVVVCLAALVGAILLDCNYFHRPAIEVSDRGVTVQYFRRRLYLPLVDIGKITLFPQGAGEIRIFPTHDSLVQREVNGYFTPSTKDQSILIYALRNGITAKQFTDALARFGAKRA